jgi:hypothetical protein
MDHQWHSIFYNSMNQPWLYFCYWFDASFRNSLMLSLLYGSCHSVFIDDFKVYWDSIFAGDLWFRSDKAFLTIPSLAMTLFLLPIRCVSHEFIDRVESIRQLSLSFQSRFPVNNNTVFTNDSMHQQRLSFLCWFHASIVNLFLLSIPCVIHHPRTVHDSMRQTRLKFCYQIHASTMILFLLSISCVGSELFDVVASIRQLSLNFHWRFQGLQGLYFRSWFMA